MKEIAFPDMFLQCLCLNHQVQYLASDIEISFFFRLSRTCFQVLLFRELGSGDSLLLLVQTTVGAEGIGFLVKGT